MTDTTKNEQFESSIYKRFKMNSHKILIEKPKQMPNEKNVKKNK